ncbi:MAG: PAS domain S-box protein, partial [Proteobacteria bacterium]|nr:PAS domain S-box protein [Pseudomonadota bacterium]
MLDCLKSAFFLIGVALALFVWILDPFINAVFLQQGTIYQQLTQLELLEIYLRSIISAIIIIFSFIGSVLLNRSRQVEKGRRRYESIVNASDNFMAIVNPDYIYLAINQRFLNIFKKNRDEIIGHSISEVMGEAHFENLSKPNIDKCLAGEHANYQTWFTYPTGEKQYYDVNYSRFQDENDAVLGVVINVSDITALKQAHESLQESEEKYRTIVETVSEWIWELDIRTGKCSYSNPMI